MGKRYKEKKLNYIPKEATLRSYGLNRDNFTTLLNHQNNSCAICLESFFKTVPHIDHNHLTGEVRGLLCVSCNTSLGRFKDSIPVLQNAITYLRFPTAFEIQSIVRR